jgi:23S rRNA pseudouridine1911/1915/1917 synthase
MVREYIRIKYDKPGNVFTGLVYRLDRQVSGVMVFARTSKAARRLFQEFSSRRVLKIYSALVHRPEGPAHEIESGYEAWTALTHFISNESGTISEVNENTDRDKEASLRYRIIASNDRYLLLLVHLLTGRKRQIRAQLSHIGMPVAGDSLYGSPEISDRHTICLHSCYLKFNHPTLLTPVEIYSDIPSRIMDRMPIDADEVKKIVLEYAHTVSSEK